MTQTRLVIAFAVALVTAPYGVVHAAGGGGDDSPPKRAVDPDVAKAEQAIDDKRWNDAVNLLTKAASRDEKNPDIYNYLGYAERNLGNMDSAFKYYEKALTIDPKHRGVHEYLGEAYLMVGNLAKAEEHLAKLDDLCFFSCKEYSELKEKIAAYKQTHASITK